MKRVLIFPAGSEIGLELLRSLKYTPLFEVIGASSVSDHAEFEYSNHIGDLPFVSDDDFLDELNKVVISENIDFIFPAHDSVVLKLAEFQSQGLLKCVALTSPLETCDVARSKQKTYELLRDKIRCPKVFTRVDAVAESDLPIFLKPAVGQGSKGTQLAETLEDVEFYHKKDTSRLLLEYLPGDEYTVDCFTDKNGKLRYCGARKRSRIINGISVRSETVSDARIKDIADKINTSLEFRGAWFFQLKEDSEGELALLEIATRIAGTSGVARSQDVNFALLTLFDAMGEEVHIGENKYRAVIDRAWGNRFKLSISYDHVYVDYDDTIIVRDKINTQLIEFLYQCVNNSIKVHLITRHSARHESTLDESLKKHHLQSLFDEIIEINEDEEKHSHMTMKSAIFIDDSFSERKKVQDELSIPVFDTHMIEGLLSHD